MPLHRRTACLACDLRFCHGYALPPRRNHAPSPAPLAQVGFVSMAKLVAQSCPRCGAPVSAGHTLLTCEFCGSELMMVRTNVAPPIVDFASAGAQPAPPHMDVAPM